ncbi:MAG: hypothetical protein ACXVQY_07575 [Actinomycetota bacterium]
MDAPEELRTAYLGRFGEFEAPIILELLQDAGIFAFTKHDPTQSDHYQYTKLMESDRGVILVDATKVEEARRIIAEELPKHLESIREAMETLETDVEPNGDRG